MRNLSEQTATPVIAFVNQKGGVGKSTLTTLLANYFYFHKGLRVAIVDADYPQNSIYKRRIENADYIRSKTWLQNLTEDLYQNRTSIQIYDTDPDEVNVTIEQRLKKYDLILLDMAGRLDQANLDKALEQVSHFFIPVLQDADTLRSSLHFFNYAASEIFPKSTAFQSCHFLLNKSSVKNLETIYRNKIQEAGGNVLQNCMYQHVVYERIFRSTLLPIPKANKKKLYYKEITRLQLFAEEVYQIVTQADVRANALVDTQGSIPNDRTSPDTFAHSSIQAGNNQDAISQESDSVPNAAA